MPLTQFNAQMIVVTGFTMTANAMGVIPSISHGLFFKVVSQALNTTPCTRLPTTDSALRTKLTGFHGGIGRGVVVVQELVEGVSCRELVLVFPEEFDDLLSLFEDHIDHGAIFHGVLDHALQVQKALDVLGVEPFADFHTLPAAALQQRLAQAGVFHHQIGARLSEERQTGSASSMWLARKRTALSEWGEDAHGVVAVTRCEFDGLRPAERRP